MRPRSAFCSSDADGRPSDPPPANGRAAEARGLSASAELPSCNSLWFEGLASEGRPSRWNDREVRARVRARHLTFDLFPTLKA